jgi:hypothetical protein
MNKIAEVQQPDVFYNNYMKIEALTDNPQQLIAAIEKALKEGDLKTWKRVANSSGETLYTHTPEQWVDKVLLKPSALRDRARFTINWWSNRDEPTVEIKGYVIGRFTEVLMVHFRNYFSKLETSS